MHICGMFLNSGHVQFTRNILQSIQVMTESRLYKKKKYNFYNKNTYLTSNKQ